jgi:Flp pilus assembly protein TadG
MMIFINKLLNKRNARERGSSEIVTTLFVVPIFIGLIFATVNSSIYFQVRSSIQNVARDGARQVALYGGNNASVPRNDTGFNVSQIVFNKLYKNGDCTYSSCSQPPLVSCGPGQATGAGQDVFCEVTYYYSPVAEDYFGFSAGTALAFKVKEQFISETGY